MHIRLVAAAFFSAALAMAQSPPNLVALNLLNTEIYQGVHGTCTQISLCPTGLPTTGQFLWQGGTAWDSQTSAVWASTGNLIGRYDPATCAVTCAPSICPRTPGSDVCGLDLYDTGNELWVIDSLGVITRCANACPPTFNLSHVITPPLVTHIPTGISIDELRGLVFFCASDFSSPTGDGRIYVAPLSNPGAWFQFSPVVDCFTSSNHRITGLAVDAANSALYWTNGRGTFRATYTYSGTPSAGSVVITPGTCCINMAPLGDPFIDLSIRWGGATSSGTACANGTCPSCPMVHSLRNAPLLGTNLQLGLDSAPVGVPAWCLINLGACGAAGTIAPLCGPIMVPLPGPVMLGPQFTTGGGPCTGTTTWILPLPANPALAGLPLASQCLALCPPAGVTLSNCLSFVLQ